jgi:hypothetical protein
MTNTGTNQSFGFTPIPYCFLGTSTSLEDPNLTGEARRVKPRKPFNWLNWNNRYINGNGLMLVPRLRSSQCCDPSTRKPPCSGAAAASVPRSPIPANAQTQAQDGTTDVFMPELLRRSQTPAAVNAARRPQRHRLDLVGTPSLFTGVVVQPASIWDINWADDPRFNRGAHSTTFPPTASREGQSQHDRQPGGLRGLFRIRRTTPTTLNRA